MRRRALFAATLSAVAAARAASTAGQTAERVWRLGHLGQNEPSELATREHTLPELAKLGFVEGRNVVFEARFGAVSALPELVRQLLAGRPDAIIAIGTLSTRTVHDATRTVPIVMFADDPVGQGFAASFARPGGNVTGIANMVVELYAKRMQLLLETVPTARRVATLLHTSSLANPEAESVLRALAAQTGVELSVFQVTDARDYPAAFAAIRAASAEALLVGVSPQFSADREVLAGLARAARLPTCCEWPSDARAGCLLGYGPEQPVLRRRMAHQIAGIFRGAAPGELPIERPTQFGFAVNLATAKALGLTIPPAVLARADEVIE